MHNGGYSSARETRRSFNWTTALDDVMREIELMEKLHHPNIVKLVETIDDDFSGKLYMVIEYAKFGQCMEWNDKAHTFYPNSNLRNKGHN